MKKQIFTLTMCLALTASAALADAVEKMLPQKTTTQATTSITATAKCPSPQNLIKQAEQPRVLTKEEVKKRVEERRIQQRVDMYYKLGLTSEQRAKAEALDARTKMEAEPLILKVQAEGKKLRELKVKKASKIQIFKQEQSFKASKKAIKKHFEASRQSFEAFLTEEQQIKFNAMSQDRMRQMKKNDCKCPIRRMLHKHRCPCKMDKPMGTQLEMGSECPLPQGSKK